MSGHTQELQKKYGNVPRLKAEDVVIYFVEYRREHISWN